MAKKVKKQKAAASETGLPQNILPIGETVDSDKKIYISQPVYKEIHKFTKNKTTNESGGMLVGKVMEAFGKTNILITGFVEAKYCEATPTTLKFTHETWDYVHKQIEKKHKGSKILGWIHTHPDFGIFLSEYDKFIHQNFFSEENQVAYVVDPIQKLEGFYFWVNGNIERSKGFYIYDKTGTVIDVDLDQETEAEKKSSVFSFQNIMIGVLTVSLVLLIFSHISTSRKLEQLEKRQATLETNVEYQLAGISDAVYQWSEGIVQEVYNMLIEAGVIQVVEETTPEAETEPAVEEIDPTTEETTAATEEGSADVSA